MNTHEKTAATLFQWVSGQGGFRYASLLMLLLSSLTMMAQAPVLYRVGVVTTPFQERDMTMSEDGNHLLYSVHSNKNDIRMIVEMMQVDGKWSSAEVVPFSGTYRDLEPMFEPGGKRLYFASDRPLHEQDDTRDYNIWYVERFKKGWGSPVPLDTTINTAGDEFYPSVSRQGTLYFTATRADSKGKEDIYYSAFDGKQFLPPVSMDTTINTATYEFNAFIAPDESYLLFSSYRRPDGFGGGDLYIAYNKEGQWQPAINLGDVINSTQLDYCPFVSPDGQTLYFTSNRTVESSARTVEALRQLMNQPQNGFDDIYTVPFDALPK